MSQQFKSVELFGGAMKVELPSTFEDVSEIRQVPDHQEVYLDRDGFSSVVIDILERVVETADGKPITSDLDALRYHLADIVGSEDAAKLQVWNTRDAYLARLPKGTPAYTLLATSPPGEKMRGRANEPDFVGVLLTLVRLDAAKTDLVLAVNVPHLPGAYAAADVDPARGKYGALLEAGVKVRERVLETFEIVDWGLFVQE